MFLEGTSPNDNDASKTPVPVSREELCSLIHNQVNETLKRTLPDILKLLSVWHHNLMGLKKMR